MNPLLSVVVIGRNEGPRLERCLRSIREMKSPGGPLELTNEVELIYVDSASTDNSLQLAKSFGARVLSVNPARPTAAIGRNAGWRAATAPLILFLDGDTVLHPEFVKNCMPAFEDPAIVAVWGHRREIHPEQSWYNRILDLDWIYKPGLTEFCGGDVLFRRTALAEVDGYDEKLIAGEEPEMCRRLRGKGYQILHVDLPMTGHDLGMSRFSQYWKRATRAGYAYAEVSERFRGSGLPFWEEDAARNRSRARQVLLIFAAGILGSFVLLSWLPFALMVAFFILISARSAFKASWKSSSIPTLLAYGFHSHFQQIPIYIGQRQYEEDKRKGRVRGLIEYKGAGQ